ncbi:MAG: class II fructose-bisphosphate aldolase [Lachnospiraceae bacterium]
MLITLKEMMRIAGEKGIAVGAFNTPNLESLRAILEAAEELGLPVILQFAQCHEELVPLSLIGPVMIGMAKAADVPVCVHLDHGETLDYLRKAIEIGFTSIMYDGSVLSYEENAANTKLAVEMAKKTGASVEAELGSMGRRESGAGDTDEEGDDNKIYTDPKQAKQFVKETGIDALACSFGTTHGIYLTEPKLDFGIVSAVRDETGGIPVVMHGGSGVSREDFHAAIEAGVRKINYFTYMDKAGGSAIGNLVKTLENGKPIFFTEAVKKATEAMKENVKDAMRTFAHLDKEY